MREAKGPLQRRLAMGLYFNKFGLFRAMLGLAKRAPDRGVIRWFLNSAKLVVHI